MFRDLAAAAVVDPRNLSSPSTEARPSSQACGPTTRWRAALDLGDPGRLGDRLGPGVCGRTHLAGLGRMTRALSEMVE